MDDRLDVVMVKRVMMIAYHFPPMNVSSGIQRTLRFAQYLPEFGWEASVLTAHARAYTGMCDASMNDVPRHLEVRRAFALDAARHLAIRGRYSRLLALPDRWWSWWLGAVPSGLACIRKTKPDVLWSTYPIATAHLIGYTLHRLTGIPWVADFRDPMAQEDYPEHRLEHRAYEWIEYQALKHCKRALFTAPGALELYAHRYGDVPRSRLALIENGYDESAFAGADELESRPRSAGPLVLLHSGVVYPSERDPRPLLAAIAQLRAAGDIGKGDLRLVLRATGCDAYLKAVVAQYDIGDIVSIQPSVPYRQALAEMMGADALLILQAANCNYQVPAKLYEYLRAGRPILALTDPEGDTATVLRSAGVDTIARLDSQEDIARALPQFLALVKAGRAPVAMKAAVSAASRRRRTADLADVLEVARE